MRIDLRALAGAFASLFCCALSLSAADRPTTAKAVVVPEPASAEEIAAAEMTPPSSPFERRVNELREAFRAQLAQLQTQYRAATDPRRAAALQRDISNLKLDLEIQLLELQQQELAQDSEVAAQKSEAAEQLETALTALRKLRGEAN